MRDSPTPHHQPGPVVPLLGDLWGKQPGGPSGLPPPELGLGPPALGSLHYRCFGGSPTPTLSWGPRRLLPQCSPFNLKNLRNPLLPLASAVLVAPSSCSLGSAVSPTAGLERAPARPVGPRHPPRRLSCGPSNSLRATRNPSRPRPRLSACCSGCSAQRAVPLSPGFRAGHPDPYQGSGHFLTAPCPSPPPGTQPRLPGSSSCVHTGPPVPSPCPGGRFPCSGLLSSLSPRSLWPPVALSVGRKRELMGMWNLCSGSDNKDFPLD